MEEIKKELKTVTLTKVSVSDKNKNGQTLITKKSKPFFKVGILTNEYGDQWINGLVFGERPTWGEKDKVELLIGKETYNGVEKLAFEVPRKDDIQGDKIDKFDIRLRFLEERLKHLETLQPKPKDDYPPESSEDIKF